MNYWPAEAEDEGGGCRRLATSQSRRPQSVPLAIGLSDAGKHEQQQTGKDRELPPTAARRSRDRRLREFRLGHRFAFLRILPIE